MKTTLEQLKLMKHTIGYQTDRVKGRKNRIYIAFRNYFVTSEGCSDYESLIELVELELMTKRAHPYNDDDSFVFHVTQKGIEYLSEVLDVKITEMD